MRSSKSPPLGFTLIELMLVVAIIGVLAAIAIPTFLKYALTSKQAEAYTVMGMIRNQQFVHFTTFGCFVATPQAPAGGPGVGKRPWDSLPTAPINRCPGPLSFADIGVEPNGDVFFVYACASQAVPAEFACHALGDLDGDGVISEIMLCSDSNADGLGIPAPSGTACTFPWDVIRTSAGLF